MGGVWSIRGETPRGLLGPRRSSYGCRSRRLLLLDEAFDFVGSEFESADAEAWREVGFAGWGWGPLDDAANGFGVVGEREDHGFAKSDAPAGFEGAFFFIEFLAPAPPAGIASGGVEVEFSLVE